MLTRLDRRALLARTLAAAGWGLSTALLAACNQAAPAQPTASTKPAEAKPAAVAASPAPAAKAPAAQGPLAKIIYAMVGYNPFHIGFVVGTEKPELMHKHGIEIEIIRTGSGPNSMQALLGGSVHIAGVSAEAIWPAQDREPDVKQIMAYIVGTPYALLVNPEIKKIAELKGKTLGATAIRGGADVTAMRVMLLENGIKDGDFDVVVVGSIAERTAAMKAGTVMAVCSLEPQISQLKDAGFPELDDANNYPMLRNVQTGLLAAKKSWYEPRMDDMVRFMRGFLEITKWIYDPKNRDETITFIARTHQVETKYAANAFDRHFVKSQTAPLNLRIDLKMIEQVAVNQRRIGAPNIPTEFEKYIDNRMVERALA